MISVNEQALEIVRRMITDVDVLGLAVTQLPNGTTVVDASVKVPGSLEAGRLFAEVCLGGLGKVRFRDRSFKNLWLPGVTVSVSHPGDFYKIDPLLSSPAEVWINNVTSGHTFQAGWVNGEMLQRAFQT